MSGERHSPVMLNEVIAALNPCDGAIYVDGTFGGGSYSRALLEAAQCRVWGIDRDPDACALGDKLAAEFDDRLTMLTGCFGDMAALLASENVDSVDGIALDLGVSSFQIDRAERGFSFREDGPLDMRMSREGPSAADIVNAEAEAPLADIIYRYGEEPRSRRVAKAIVEARPLERTGQLAGVVRKALGHKPHNKKDPATRTFQAIRIHVNREPEELERGLEAAEAMLEEGGRLAVVTFHSLEDRIVKQFLRNRSGSEASGSRHLPQLQSGPAPTFERPAKAVRPGMAELARNPRSRSATLRSAVRTSAPVSPRRTQDRKPRS